MNKKIGKFIFSENGSQVLWGTTLSSDLKKTRNNSGLYIFSFLGLCTLVALVFLYEFLSIAQLLLVTVLGVVCPFAFVRWLINWDEFDVYGFLFNLKDVCVFVRYFGDGEREATFESICVGWGNIKNIEKIIDIDGEGGEIIQVLVIFNSKVTFSGSNKSLLEWRSVYMDEKDVDEVCVTLNALKERVVAV
jgi:hypothetical protein